MITLGSNGALVNPNEDFRISGEGMRLKGSANFTTGAALRFFNDEADNPNDQVGSLVSHGTAGNRQLRLTAQNGYDLMLTTNEGSHIRLMPATNSHIFAHGLPTSDPGIAGALWRNGTDVRVSSITSSVPGTPGQPNICLLSSPNRLRISWSSVSGALNYTVQRNAGSGWATLTTISGTSLDDPQPGMNPSQVYSYRVQACNSSGCSNFSSAASDSVNNAQAC